LSSILVASDYDRTISDEKDGFVIDNIVKEKINNFSKTNYFVVVTGRERRFIDRLAYGLEPTGWVLENGALIVINNYVHYNIPKSWPKLRFEIGRRLSSKNLSFTYGEVIIYLNNASVSLCDLLSDLQGVSIEWNRNDAMILPSGVNKGSGIMKFIELLGFKGKIIAVGDSQNDISLFRVANFKVAVNNALNEIKELADLVLNKDDGQGIIELLDYIDSGEIYKLGLS
jgi:phosphoglycolate phosphatase (TIGR01487 family)